MFNTPLSVAGSLDQMNALAHGLRAVLKDAPAPFNSMFDVDVQEAAAAPPSPPPPSSPGSPPAAEGAELGC